MSCHGEVLDYNVRGTVAVVTCGLVYTTERRWWTVVCTTTIQELRSTNICVSIFGVAADIADSVFFNKSVLLEYLLKVTELP